MAKQRSRDLKKEADWRERIKRQAESGVTVRAFCEGHNLKESSFQYWKRELARRDEEALAEQSPRSRKKARSLRPRRSAVSPLLPVTIGPPSKWPGVLEVMLADGTAVCVCPGCDHDTFRMVLDVLQRS